MKIEDVRSLLEAHKNERGIKHWQKTGIPLSSYGIGLTQLKKIARKIGRDHDLARELWSQENYDMICLSTMIEEPEKITREQVEIQVKELGFWMLAHAYCSNLMPRVSFQQTLAEEWLHEKDDLKRRFAYLLVYNIARDNKNLDDTYFLPIIDIIQSNIRTEENFVKDAMNNALIMIGSRSSLLNEKALVAAMLIGKIEVDYGDNSCQALNAEMHLSSRQVQKKLGG